MEKTEIAEMQEQIRLLKKENQNLSALLSTAYPCIDTSVDDEEIDVNALREDIENALESPVDGFAARLVADTLFGAADTLRTAGCDDVFVKRLDQEGVSVLKESSLPEQVSLIARRQNLVKPLSIDIIQNIIHVVYESNGIENALDRLINLRKKIESGEKSFHQLIKEI